MQLAASWQTREYSEANKLYKRVFSWKLTPDEKLPSFYGTQYSVTTGHLQPPESSPHLKFYLFNPSTSNDLYMSRTAPLNSKRCILYIYSTNIGTEYFKNALYSPFFSSKCSLFHNANLFGSCIIHILYTGCAKI